jgi:hypothetical protein
MWDSPSNIPTGYYSDDPRIGQNAMDAEYLAHYGLKAGRRRPRSVSLLCWKVQIRAALL